MVGANEFRAPPKARKKKSDFAQRFFEFFACGVLTGDFNISGKAFEWIRYDSRR